MEYIYKYMYILVQEIFKQFYVILLVFFVQYIDENI